MPMKVKTGASTWSPVKKLLVKTGASTWKEATFLTKTGASTWTADAMTPSSVTVGGALINYITTQESAYNYKHAAEPWETLPAGLDGNGYFGFNVNSVPHVLMVYFTTGSWTGQAKTLRLMLNAYYTFNDSTTGCFQIATADTNYLNYKGIHGGTFPTDALAIAHGTFTMAQSSSSGYAKSYINATVTLEPSTQYVMYVWLNQSNAGALGYVPNATSTYISHSVSG